MNDNPDDDSEPVENMSANKPRKHKFYDDYHYDKDFTEGTNEFQQEDDAGDKVEETPDKDQIEFIEKEVCKF